MSTRSNPFENRASAEPKPDLSSFKPRTRTAKPAVDRAAIEQIAQEQDLSSRRPEKPVRKAARRNATGRNQQVNIKTTPEAVALLYELADKRGVPLGKVFEDALDALKKQD